MPNKLTQHEIRQHAVQALFTLSARPDTTATDAIGYAVDGKEPGNLEAVKTLVAGVLAQQEALDKLIAQYLTKDWTISRLTRIDATILRLGAYEITATDTPDVVAVDEAVNLAHDFSDDSAASLINGVLTNLIKKA